MAAVTNLLAGRGVFKKDEAMVQVRKLVLAIAAASALSSGMAQALQLSQRDAILAVFPV